MRTPMFRIPESFRLSEFLMSPEAITYRDEAHYFISTILTKLARDNVDRKGLIRLSSVLLRKIMSPKGYEVVIDALLKGKAVRRAKYQAGTCCFGYSLSERYAHGKHVAVVPQKTRLLKCLERAYLEIEQDRHSRKLEVHLALDRLQTQLRIRGDLARSIIANLPPSANRFDVQGILLSDIERRRFWTNVGRYGRCSNNITSMKREVRTALRVNNKPLHHLDIKCCQPALLGLLYHRLNSQCEQYEKDSIAELPRTQEEEGRVREKGNYVYKRSPAPKRGPELYHQLVQRGELYEFLILELRKRGIEMCRQKLKKKFLSDVIAKRKANSTGAEYPSAVEDCFRELFPQIYSFVRSFNHDGWEHSNLIRELQRQESSLVIETVAADLVRSYPDAFLLTLHDAIFTTEEHIPIVASAFENAFRQIDYPMSLEVSV